MTEKPVAIKPTPWVTPPGRARLRELGIIIGRHPTGPWNAITDVTGVRVGHTTLISGDGTLVSGKGPVRTGVTCVMPSNEVFIDRPLSSAFVLNGAGEVSGVTQLQEWGFIETPIMLCNTMSVGKVSDATGSWMTRRIPGIGTEWDVVIPVVGECDDSYLNDVVGRHVRAEHVYHALDKAAPGPVAEGAVGAGTGMICCDFKAGIGTSSRRVSTEGQDRVFNIGVLVLSNFGTCRNLRVDGVPIGELLEADYRSVAKRMYNYGSIICVVATDAPLLPSQIGRLCKRAALGIGRCGSYAAHGSGEIIVGFSTGNTLPRSAKSGMTHHLEVLLDPYLGPIYEATIECTEEAILNSLTMAPDMTGHGENFAPGLPLDRLVELMKRYRPSRD